ncbi:helix-turn-helix domain-containing protein [Vagococcus hydrophili]|uniref:Helix-turn-helix transcriptional regulator n=1 Tax=Vagococcus hydrophili TaxID=2714947 RepID=A0A6G8AXJ8_9ENTE|nr:helix-turn-helix transcriptional regulator [Vagococcus hydrophili]QIL49682.1 helix-turn-helix transcriptional regulator [Vagococcus hydrophili]
MGLHLKIKEERSTLGISQEKLAEKIGVSTKAIANWENGSKRPGLENCKKLRTVFGVTLDYILKDDIELKSKYDEYAKLGEKILELVGEEYPIDFIKNYYIVAREPSILIPRTITEEFIDDINQRMSKLKDTNYKEIDSIQSDMGDFIFFWYKFNKAKHLISKNLKLGNLLLNSVSYTEKEVLEQLNNPIARDKPVLLLRNLMIGSLI